MLSKYNYISKEYNRLLYTRYKNFIPLRFINHKTLKHPNRLLYTRYS